MEKAKPRGLNKSVLEGYYEKHHIVPKCLGGDDSEDNFVLFTAREHIIAHKLLWKQYPDNVKLMWAYNRTVSPRRNMVSTRDAALLRKAKAKAMSERVVTQETKDKISATLKGHKRDRNSVEKGAAKLRGRKASPERIEKQTKHRRELIASGWTHSEESRKKIGEASKNRGEISEETRKRMSDASKLRGISIKAREAASVYQKSLLPWERSGAKSSAEKRLRWKLADYYYDFWCFIGKPKMHLFTSTLNSLQSTDHYQGYFQKMVSMFHEGWVPEEDPKWCEFISNE